MANTRIMKANYRIEINEDVLSVYDKNNNTLLFSHGGTDISPDQFEYISPDQFDWMGWAADVYGKDIREVKQAWENLIDAAKNHKPIKAHIGGIPVQIAIYEDAFNCVDIEFYENMGWKRQFLNMVDETIFLVQVDSASFNDPERISEAISEDLYDSVNEYKVGLNQKQKTGKIISRILDEFDHDLCEAIENFIVKVSEFKKIMSQFVKGPIPHNIYRGSKEFRNMAEEHGVDPEKIEIWDGDMDMVGEFIAEAIYECLCEEIYIDFEY
jgi:hypothetical protein